MGYKIYKNHTLSEYISKYKNTRYLARYSKKELENFDKKHGVLNQNLLLNNHKWWLIGDTYYQIPGSCTSWWKNLPKAVKITGCCLLGAGVVTAAIVPTVMNMKKDKSEEDVREVSIDGTIEHVKCTSKMVDGNLEITLTPDEDYVITDIKKILIGSHELSKDEYVFETNEVTSKKVTIKKDILAKYPGKIVLTPIVASLKGKIEIVSRPTKLLYFEGERFSKDGLKVNYIKESGEVIDVTNECSLSIEDGHEFVEADISDEKEIIVTYKDSQSTFIISVNGAYSRYLEFENEGSFYIRAKRGAKLPKNLIIPEKLNDKEIYGIVMSGFENNLDIETVDIKFNGSQSSSNGISPKAFKNCKNLKKVTIENEINVIGRTDANVFTNCLTLEEINFKNKNEIAIYSSNDNKNFVNCPKLKTVYIDSESFAKIGVSSIDPSLYYNVDDFYIPKGTDISGSFLESISAELDKTKSTEKYDCYTTQKLEYKSLGSNKCCVKVKEGYKLKGNITIPEKDPKTEVIVEEIEFESQTFDTLIFPSTMKNIVGLKNCNIKKVVLDDALEKIGDSSLSGSIFEEINLPKNFTLSSRPFEGVIIKKIYIDSEDSEILDPKVESYVENELFYHLDCKEIYINKDLSLSEETLIAKNYKKTGVEGNYNIWEMNDDNYLKFSYSNLEESSKTCSIARSNTNYDMFWKGDLIIPDNIVINDITYKITEILNNKKEPNNYTVDNIKLGKNVETVAHETFNYFFALKNAVLNEGLKTIGYNCFYNCSSLEEINIPSSVDIESGLGPNAFSGCSKLQTVVLDNQNFVDAEQSPSNLYDSAIVIYIKDTLTDPKDGTYIKDSGFHKYQISDRQGYTKWVRSSFKS